MKTNIRNIYDLRSERSRLQNELQLTRIKMKNNVAAIKQDLSPARHVLDFLGNFLTNRHNGLLKIGVGVGVDTIVRRGIMRRAPWPLKLLVPFLLKNFAGNMIHKNREAIVAQGLTWVKDVTEEKRPIQNSIIEEYDYSPSFVEKALMWVKDVTEEKPLPTAEEIILHDNRPSFIERALMWVKDVTEEKPQTEEFAATDIRV